MLNRAGGGLKIPLKNLFDDKIYNKIKDKTNPIITKPALVCLKKNLER